VVDDEPDVRDTYQNLRLRAESLALKGSLPVRRPGWRWCVRRATRSAPTATAWP